MKIHRADTPAISNPPIANNAPKQQDHGHKDSDIIKPWSKLPSEADRLPFAEKITFGGWGKSKGKAKAAESGGSSSSSNPGFCLHHVPYVSQGKERNGCWYACARMLGHSIQSGPRLGLPQSFQPEPVAIGDRADMLELMRNEGLGEIPLPRAQKFSLDQLGNLLCRHGPIMFGWQVPSGIWHMSVLTGTDNINDRVIFHDPQKGPGMTMPLSYFNNNLAWSEPHAMLYSK